MADKEQPQDPNKKPIREVGAELGADLSRAMVAAINKTIAATKFNSLNKALIKGLGTIDVSKALDFSGVEKAMIAALKVDMTAVGGSIKDAIKSQGPINASDLIDLSGLQEAARSAARVPKPPTPDRTLSGSVGEDFSDALVDQQLLVQREFLSLQNDVKATWDQISQKVQAYGSLLEESEGHQLKTITSLNRIHDLSTRLGKSLEQQEVRERLVKLSRAEQLAIYTSAIKLQRQEWSMAENLGDLYEQRLQLQNRFKTGLTGAFALQATELGLLKRKGILTEAEFQNALRQLKTQQQIQQEGQKGLDKLEARIVRERELKDLIKEYNAQSEIREKLGSHQHHLSEQLVQQGMQYEGVQKDIAAMLEQEDQTTADLLLKKVMVGTGLKDQYAQLLTTLMLEKQITNLQDPRVASLVREMKHRQHINEHLQHQVELEESMAHWQLELLEELEEYGKGWEKLKSRVLAVVSDPKLLKSFLTVKGLEAIKESLEETKEIFGEFRSEGLTFAQSFHETQVALGSMFSLSGASMEEAAHIQGALVKEMGSMDNVTKDTVVSVGKLSKTLGISAQMAGQLQGQLASMPLATAESATDTLEFAGALAKAAHVAPGAVMEDIAHNAEATATFSKDGSKNIAIAAVAAKKLGVEFGSIVKMADGLLNFENSINKQLEASVLLGREINLDRARELALNGDLVGATQEMLANVGGEAEFNRMNVLQRKALADSMGVSVQELSKMVKNQDKLNTLTEDQQKALAEGSMTWDEILGNAQGVGSRLWEGASAAGALLINVQAIGSGLKASVDTAKDMWAGFKEGAGLLGKLKGAVSGAFGNTPEVTTPAKSMEGVSKTAEHTAKLGKAAEQGPKAKSGQGVRDFLTNLSAGLRSMAGGDVLFGAANMIPASVGLTAMIPGAVGAKVLEMIKGEKLQQALQGLATGLEAMSKGKVALGSLVLLPTALGFAAMTAGAIGLGAVALLGAPAGLGLSAISTGLSALGSSGALKGVLVLGLMGAALIPAAYAFSLLKEVDVDKMVAFSIALPLLGLAAAGLGALSVLILMGAVSIGAIGASMIAVAVAMMLFEKAEGGINVLRQFTSSLIADAAAIPLMGMLGAGLAALGVSALLAAPGLGLLSLVLPGLAGSVALLGSSFMVLQSGVSPVIDQLTSLVSLTPGLYGVGGGLMSIAAGLSAVAAAGLLALPALVGIDSIADTFIGLGGSTGGGSSTQSTEVDTEAVEQKLDLLIQEVRTLVEVASKGGVVNLDGRRVGDVLRLGLNSSGMR